MSLNPDVEYWMGTKWGPEEKLTGVVLVTSGEVVETDSVPLLLEEAKAFEVHDDRVPPRVHCALSLGDPEWNMVLYMDEETADGYTLLEPVEPDWAARVNYDRMAPRRTLNRFSLNLPDMDAFMDITEQVGEQVQEALEIKGEARGWWVFATVARRPILSGEPETSL